MFILIEFYIILANVTNIERKNLSILYHHARYGPIPIKARGFLINIFFIKWSNSPVNNGFIDNIKFYIKQINETDESLGKTYNNTFCP
jgi:hypothetical protein